MAAWIVNSLRSGLCTGYLCLPHLTPPSTSIPACPVNQCGWQCAAVRELERNITHVKLGQDLSCLNQRRGSDSRRFDQRYTLSSLFLFLFQSSEATDMVNLLLSRMSNVCPVFLWKDHLVCPCVCTNDCLLCCKYLQVQFEWFYNSDPNKVWL